MGVEELDGVEAAAVDVEVDVAAVEVGRDRLPDPRLRVARLDGAPDGQAQAPALDPVPDVEEVEVVASAHGVDGDDRPAQDLTVLDGDVGGGTRARERGVDVLLREHVLLLPEAVPGAQAERLAHIGLEPREVLLLQGLQSHRHQFFLYCTFRRRHPLAVETEERRRGTGAWCWSLGWSSWPGAAWEGSPGSILPPPHPRSTTWCPTARPGPWAPSGGSG